MTHSIIILKIIKETIKKFCQGYCDRYLLNYSIIVKHFWIAYSQCCECLCIIQGYDTYISSLYDYLDKCIAECFMYSNTCNKYWILKKISTSRKMHYVWICMFDIIIQLIIN
jgi:hypothetical protein